ncbi:MAG: glycosyltransferase family 39 protein [Prosthecobacter sp.]|nr:glycosyltransferase family 39 protein [Prosthecobacter sp.]
MTSLPPASASDALWSRRFWWLLAGVFVFRTLFLLFFTASADLAGDEAYYWDWGRRPDWGYFSKPPMIGWLMGFVGWLTHDAEWGVRGAALLMGTGTLACLFLLARRLYDARTAFLATGLILLTPGNAGLNLFLTIDAPLLLMWSLGLLLFWKAAEKPASWSLWLSFGLVLGLGALSKQMMLVQPLLIIIFAALSRADRTLLKNPRFWIATLIGIAFLTPVLWWNQQHQWITLEHTKHHFDSESLSFGKWLGRTFEFPGVQALVYTPVTFAALVTVLWLGLRHWRQMLRRERFLLIFSALPFVVFMLLALRQHMNANWPAVYYVPAFILAAAWWNGHLPFPAAAAWRKWSLRTAIAITVAAHLLIVGVIGPRPEFWESCISVIDTRVNSKLAARLQKSVAKLGDIKGWNEAGRQGGEFLAKVPRPSHTFVLTIGYRYDAAQMAFNIPSHPRVYRWEPSGKVMSQYEVWPGPEERLGDDALIFAPGNDATRPLADVIAHHFEKVEPLGKVRVPLGKDHQRIFDVYLGRNLRSWDAVGTLPSP